MPRDFLDSTHSSDYTTMEDSVSSCMKPILEFTPELTRFFDLSLATNQWLITLLRCLRLLLRPLLKLRNLRAEITRHLDIQLLEGGRAACRPVEQREVVSSEFGPCGLDGPVSHGFGAVLLAPGYCRQDQRSSQAGRGDLEQSWPWMEGFTSRDGREIEETRGHCLQ